MILALSLGGSTACKHLANLNAEGPVAGGRRTDDDAISLHLCPL